MRRLGAVLAIGGVTFLVGYAGYYGFKGFFTSAEIPLVIKIVIPAILAGILLLLVSVIWDRYQSSKRESFGGEEK